MLDATLFLFVKLINIERGDIKRSSAGIPYISLITFLTKTFSFLIFGLHLF